MNRNPAASTNHSQSTKKKVLCGSLIVILVISVFHHLSPGKTWYEEASGKNTVRYASGSLSRSAQKLKDAVKKSETIEQFDAAGLPFTKSIPNGKNYDVCIVGAGLSGAIMAERYASILGKTSVVMDVRTHIGGNCYDFREPLSGIMMNLYGAHLFHTNLDRVYKYITKWQDKAPWRRYDHEVVGWLNKKLLPIPVNINTVNGLFDSSIQTSEEMDEWLKSVQIPCENPDACKDAEEMAKSRVGKDLFDMVFKTYTKKQWDKEPKELDALVTARIPVRNNYDPRYFSDKYQVLPERGYSKWFAQVLGHEKIDVVLGVDYFKVKKSLEGRCGKTIFTGPIDGYFSDSGLGKLEYRSINFEADILENKGFYQTHSVVNYPGPEVDFTRIVEYKHYFHQKSDYTVTVKEYSTDKGDPYYPVPNPQNHELYKKYQELAKKEEKKNNVYFVGRLASYKYFNMDAAIDNVLNMFNDIEGHPAQPDIEDGISQEDVKASTVSEIKGSPSKEGEIETKEFNLPVDNTSDRSVDQKPDDGKDLYKMNSKENRSDEIEITTKVETASDRTSMLSTGIENIEDDIGDKIIEYKGEETATSISSNESSEDTEQKTKEPEPEPEPEKNQDLGTEENDNVGEDVETEDTSAVVGANHTEMKIDKAIDSVLSSMSVDIGEENLIQFHIETRENKSDETEETGNEERSDGTLTSDDVNNTTEEDQNEPDQETSEDVHDNSSEDQSGEIESVLKMVEVAMDIESEIDKARKMMDELEENLQ